MAATKKTPKKNKAPLVRRSTSRNDPMAVMRADRQQAIHASSQVGRDRMVEMLTKAQRSLNARLKQAVGLSGPGPESFTAAQLQTTLMQIRAVLVDVKGGMETTVLDTGKRTAESAALNTIEYIRRAERQFMGISQRLAIREAVVLDRAASGTESSILHRLQGDPNKGPGILQRYGDSVVKNFEERLQSRFIEKKPWADVRNELIADSDFLQQQPMFWAERIVRTEVMAAHNRASFEGLRAVNQEVGGGMLKILSATFDNRTGADSYAVHGQIRRPNEAFEDWTHAYQTPPNRPNDREIPVPHNMEWPIPDSLKWKSDMEVSSRWTELGRKGSPPSRPLMTTVPLEKIGQTA